MTDHLTPDTVTLVVDGRPILEALDGAAAKAAGERHAGEHDDERLPVLPEGWRVRFDEPSAFREETHRMTLRRGASGTVIADLEDDEPDDRAEARAEKLATGAQAIRTLIVARAAVRARDRRLLEERVLAASEITDPVERVAAILAAVNPPPAGPGRAR